MIIVKLKDILAKEERSLHWVSVKTGITYSTLFKFNKGETNSVSFNLIEQLCILFNCNIQDIIEFKKD